MNRVQLKNKKTGAVAVHQIDGPKEDAEAWVKANNDEENNDLEAKLLGENEKPEESKPPEQQQGGQQQGDQAEKQKAALREELQKRAQGGDVVASKRLAMLDKPLELDDKGRADLQRRAQGGDADARSTLAALAESEQTQTAAVTKRAEGGETQQPSGPLEPDYTGRNVTNEGPGSPPIPVQEGQTPHETRNRAEREGEAQHRARKDR